MGSEDEKRNHLWFWNPNYNSNGSLLDNRKLEESCVKKKEFYIKNLDDSFKNKVKVMEKNIREQRAMAP